MKTSILFRISCGFILTSLMINLSAKPLSGSTTAPEKQSVIQSKSATVTTDSLLIKLNEANAAIKALQDTAAVREKIIYGSRNRTDLIFKSLQFRKTLLYIFAPLLLLVLALMYYALSRNLKNEIKEKEVMIANLSQTLDDEIDKLKKELLKK